MAYLRVGTYKGKAGLSEMAGLFHLLPRFQEGYRALTGRTDETKALFWALLADTFPGKWQNCLLAALGAGDVIPLHTDGALAEGVTRHHLVLQSNPMAWCFHGEEWQQLDEGCIYVMDPAVPHAAINWGEEPRVHLVVDLVEEKS